MERVHIDVSEFSSTLRADFDASLRLRVGHEDIEVPSNLELKLLLSRQIVSCFPCNLQASMTAGLVERWDGGHDGFDLAFGVVWSIVWVRD